MTDGGAYEHYRRGMALIGSHDFHAAAVALEQAKRLEPRKASIREALGRAYLSTRRYEEAAREFGATVELAPTDHYAHYGLGRSLERLGERDLARRHFTLARCFGSNLV